MITFLRAVPWLFAAVCIALAAYYRGDMLHSRTVAILATAERNTALREMDIQREYIAQQDAQTKRNDAILSSIVTRLTEINRAVTDTQATVYELEKTNADVRAYMDSVVPHELRRVLNRK